MQLLKKSRTTFVVDEPSMHGLIQGGQDPHVGKKIFGIYFFRYSSLQIIIFIPLELITGTKA